MSEYVDKDNVETACKNCLSYREELNEPHFTDPEREGQFCPNTEDWVNSSDTGVNTECVKFESRFKHLTKMLASRKNAKFAF